jgi:flagellar biosynthesis chaperone FliJ
MNVEESGSNKNLATNLTNVQTAINQMTKNVNQMAKLLGEYHAKDDFSKGTVLDLPDYTEISPTWQAYQSFVKAYNQEILKLKENHDDMLNN